MGSSAAQSEIEANAAEQGVGSDKPRVAERPCRAALPALGACSSSARSAGKERARAMRSWRCFRFQRCATCRILFSSWARLAFGRARRA